MGRAPSEEFVRMAVDRVVRGAESVSVVAADLGYHRTTVGGWVRQHLKKEMEAKKGIVAFGYRGPGLRAVDRYDKVVGNLGEHAAGAIVCRSATPAHAPAPEEPLSKTVNGAPPIADAIVGDRSGCPASESRYFNECERIKAELNAVVGLSLVNAILTTIAFAGVFISKPFQRYTFDREP